MTVREIFIHGIFMAFMVFFVSLIFYPLGIFFDVPRLYLVPVILGGSGFLIALAVYLAIWLTQWVGDRLTTSNQEKDS